MLYNENNSMPLGKDFLVYAALQTVDYYNF